MIFSDIYNRIHNELLNRNKHKYAVSHTGRHADVSHQPPHRPLDEPFPPWRRRVVVLSRHFAGALVYLFGFRIHLKGRDNLRKAYDTGREAARDGGRLLPESLKAVSPNTPSRRV